ncbi:MAG TPA: glycosyltransferase family 2 protein [Steroidobacteraceae bacterium]|nr:glycosyltransferase family 2 protein [Steroidobacteraceae bacterium]
MEKPLMRTFQNQQTISGSGAGALAVVPPVRMTGVPREPGELWSYAVYALIAVVCVIVGYYQFHIIVLRILALAAKQHEIRPLAYLGLFWLGLGFLLIVIRTIFWIAYRPAAPATRESAPSLTVIIPAYNEGAMVLQSIESVAKADYPHDRLEILVVDDGSKDDTWSYISQAAARYPGLVTALRQDRNRGKREALALGFSRARGEVLVTIDSDSVIERGALLALAGPFRDPKIGAVAGRVEVYNRGHGIIPQMLHVRYMLSFDMLRATESVYRNVYCCPGALTGLRAAGVRKVLDRWKNQQFLGSRCTFGEDRAMTNYLLDSGYDTVYQRTAVVRTLVPISYVKLCKMLLRWDRSYVREEIRFTRIVWKRPWPTRVMAMFDRAVTNFRYPASYSSLGLLPILMMRDPAITMPMVATMGAMSVFSVLYFLRTERSRSFLYGVLYTYYSAIALFWIMPYAVATVRSRKWMTR